MKPEIYVFIPPNLKHNLPNDGIKHCCLGWQAENDVLLCPRKRPKCHIFCLQVLSEDVSPNLGEALLDEAKRCGAGEIFIDCEKASDNLSETCKDLSSRGIRVFSSADLKGDCLHVTHWGRHRILTPKCRKTVLAENSNPRKTDISRSELKSLIHRYSPKENYSRELDSCYFSVKNRYETLFAVYDTPASFRQKISSCGAESIFLTFDVYRDYLLTED